MPFTAQSGTAAAVGTRLRPIGAAGLVCRRSTRFARRTLAAGIGRRTTVIAGFVGYVAVRVARTRGADTAGVGRGTSVVTGNRRRTAIGVGFTGSTTVTGVIFGTAICTVFRRDGTIGTKSTAVVFTAAGSSRYFILSRPVGRIVFELGFAYTLVIFTLTGSS